MKQTRWSFLLTRVMNPQSFQKYCVLMTQVESEAQKAEAGLAGFQEGMGSRFSWRRGMRLGRSGRARSPGRERGPSQQAPWFHIPAHHLSPGSSGQVINFSLGPSAFTGKVTQQCLLVGLRGCGRLCPEAQVWGLATGEPRFLTQYLVGASGLSPQDSWSPCWVSLGSGLSSFTSALCSGAAEGSRQHSATSHSIASNPPLPTGRRNVSSWLTSPFGASPPASLGLPSHSGPACAALAHTSFPHFLHVFSAPTSGFANAIPWLRTTS